MTPPRQQDGQAGFRVPVDADAGPLRQLARVTGELVAATDMAGVVDAAVTHIADAIHAAVATLMIREGDRLVMLGGHGLQPGVAEQWSAFELAHDNPASDAARTGRPVVIGSSATVLERYASLQGQMPAGRSLVCLPLGREQPVGVIGLTFEQGWTPGPRELDFLTTFTDACAEAIRRIRASARADAAATKLAFLAAASAELASSLDYRTTLSRVAQLAVPRLADWCAVQILDDEHRLQTVAVAHVDPDKVAWAWDLQRRYPPDPDDPTGAPAVARTGVSELVEQITDDMLVAGARDEEHLRLARELELTSAMVVPLTARGRTLGAITLLRAGGDPYTTDDLALAEDLGRRAALSIDNARLHGAAEQVALRLQHAVLPDRLVLPEGWEVAADYEPGGVADVGGDFYDALALPDGRVAVFVGDVMGRGLDAAAAMAQLRSAVRAYLCHDPEPAAVLGELDRMVERLPFVRLATLVYAVLDPGRGRVTVCNAGHLPPLVIPRDGAPRLLETDAQRPLGVPCPQRVATTAPLTAGDTLLLYTDGLVERRNTPIDAGLARLVQKATTLRDGPSALPVLVAELRGDGVDDDVTAVALRFPRDCSAR